MFTLVRAMRAQDPAYRPARPPPTSLTCDVPDFKIAWGTSGAYAVGQLAAAELVASSDGHAGGQPSRWR
jgi:hypothetical protein